MISINSNHFFINYKNNTNNSNSAKPNITNKNILERSPKTDSFNKTDPKVAASIALASMLTAFLAVGYALDKRRINKSLTKEIEGKNKLIFRHLTTPEDKPLSESAQKYADEYSEKIKNVKLDYDWSKPPQEIEGFHIPSYYETFKIKRLTPFKAKQQNNPTISTPELKYNFYNTDKLCIQIPEKTPIHPVKSDKAFIGNNPVENLGKTVETDFTLAYGERVNWSEEKIARDIMQNFYDGHGNTLDGVKLEANRLDNGKTKIKISGKGVYGYEDIKNMGAGNKTENLKNAGGFGEGSKILVANMLGKGDTEAIIYSSADWSYKFTPNGRRMICRTLNKTDQPIDGNSIEFETGNPKLVEAIIDSVNYFKHSQNPDFQGLTYDSEKFGFKILKPTEKGNIYLTQRFEFDGSGQWEKPMDGISLMFHEKPNPAEYECITGQKLPKDRDRTHLTHDDIENMTHYFSTKEMDNETLMRAILSTKEHWGTKQLSYNKDTQTPLKSFVKGLLKTAEKRHMALDLQDERYACLDKYGFNDTVTDSLNEYGYKILPEEFDKIYFPNTTDAFKSLSIHKPVQPNTKELQKMKLLSQSVDVISNDIDFAYRKKLAQANVKITPELLKSERIFTELVLKNKLIKNDKNIRDLIFCKPDRKLSDFDYSPLKDEECNEELANALTARINSLFKEMATTNDEEEMKECTELINNIKILAAGSKNPDPKLTEYLTTIKDLSIIQKSDAKKHVFLFDRHNEIAQNTLGESMVTNDYMNKEYLGHWIDKEYLDNADYNTLLGTWLHEITHKCGGDGTSNFTYALTDLVRVLLPTNMSNETKDKLIAIEKVYKTI